MMMTRHFQRLVPGLTKRIIIPHLPKWLPATSECSMVPTHVHSHHTLTRSAPHINIAVDGCRTPCVGHTSVQPVRFAGHSHWQNTRHTKAASDKIKSKASTKIVQKIQIALKVDSSPDPKSNRELARAFEEGKSMNVPMVVMTDTVKRITTGLEKGAPVLVEVRGFGNSLFILECFTDKQAHLRNMVKHITKKCGATVLEGGRVVHSFDHKGVVFVRPDETRPLDMDAATELAIEVGAEEVVTGMNDEGQEMLEFYCDPKDLHEVKMSLQAQDVTVAESRFTYIPLNYVKLEGVELKYAGEMIDLMLDLETVIRIHDNIEAVEDPAS